MGPTLGAEQFTAWAQMLHAAGDDDISAHRFRATVLGAAVQLAIVESK